MLYSGLHVWVVVVHVLYEHVRSLHLKFSALHKLSHPSSSGIINQFTPIDLTEFVVIIFWGEGANIKSNVSTPSVLQVLRNLLKGERVKRTGS